MLHEEGCIQGKSACIHMCEDSHQGSYMECMDRSRLYEELCIQAREVCMYTHMRKTHFGVLPHCVDSCMHRRQTYAAVLTHMMLIYT